MFHKWIGRELARIKEEDLIEPEYEMNPKTDHVLGEMSEELKRLFTLWRKTGQVTRAATKTAREALKKIILELPAEANDTDLDEAKKKAEQLETSICIAKEREDAMCQVFWVSVRDEFPGANDKSLAVCKGFKVAWIEGGKEPMPQTIGVIIPVKF